MCLLFTTFGKSFLLILKSKVLDKSQVEKIKRLLMNSS